MKYMEVMRAMYNKIAGRDLLREDGRVRPLRKLSDQEPPLWSHIVLRAPVYFELTFLGPDVNGKAKQLASKTFSAKVCARFRAVCPTVAVGTKPLCESPEADSQHGSRSSANGLGY